MEVVYQRCAGLDVHKKTVTVCLITPEGKEIRTFFTMTSDLLKLVDWLTENRCESVAMESTGSYWKPVYNLIENTGMKVMIINAQHIKMVPGRKTDVKDSEWIADLLQHGLLKASYIPDRDQRELRELTRYRRDLIEERAREKNRLQKILEGCNIKLGDVATDVLGKSSRDILDAIADGEDNPEQLAEMARGKLKNKREYLLKALEGIIREHQRFMIMEILDNIDHINEKIVRISVRIEEKMRPFDELLERMDEIPGVSKKLAEDIVVEIGTEMERFPTAGHLSSWAGMCGNNKSAGKQISTRTKPGNEHLKRTLVEVANAASRTKGTYFYSMYRRISGRRGSKKAKVAVAHAILEVIYNMIKKGTRYKDLGENFHDEMNKDKVISKLVNRIQNLGYTVNVEKAA